MMTALINILIAVCSCLLTQTDSASLLGSELTRKSRNTTEISNLVDILHRLASEDRSPYYGRQDGNTFAAAAGHPPQYLSMERRASTGRCRHPNSVVCQALYSAGNKRTVEQSDYDKSSNDEVRSKGEKQYRQSDQLFSELNKEIDWSKLLPRDSQYTWESVDRLTSRKQPQDELQSDTADTGIQQGSGLSSHTYDRKQQEQKLNYLAQLLAYKMRNP